MTTVEARCTCGRLMTARRLDGERIAHRVQAGNPIAPWCVESKPYTRSHAGRPIDEGDVQAALQGRGRDVRPMERIEAVRRLTEQGLSARLIGEQLGITERAVVRLRAALRRRTS